MHTTFIVTYDFHIFSILNIGCSICISNTGAVTPLTGFLIRGIGVRWSMLIGCTIFSASNIITYWVLEAEVYIGHQARKS